MKKTIAFLLSALLILTATGCSLLDKLKNPSYPEEAQEEIVDPNYPVVIGAAEISEKPERVVSLSPSLTEQIADLGYEDQLVGVSKGTIYPPMTKSLPQCGLPLLPDVSQIVKLDAQVVVTQTPLPEEIERQLADEKIVVVVLSPPQNLAELWESYHNLGRIFAGKEAGLAHATQMTEETAGWVADFFAVAKKQEEQSVLYIRSFPFVVATGDTFMGDLLSQMGLANIAQGEKQWVFSSDALLTGETVGDFQKLDRLILDKGVVTIQQLEGHEYYRILPVVINDEYIEVNPEALDTQGFRMFQELLFIGKKLWPDADFPSWEERSTGLPSIEREEDSEENGEEIELPFDDVEELEPSV